MLGDQTCRIEQDILLTDEFGLIMGFTGDFCRYHSSDCSYSRQFGGCFCTCAGYWCLYLETKKY